MTPHASLPSPNTSHGQSAAFCSSSLSICQKPERSHRPQSQSLKLGGSGDCRCQPGWRCRRGKGWVTVVSLGGYLYGWKRRWCCTQAGTLEAMLIPIISHESGRQRARHVPHHSRLPAARRRPQALRRDCRRGVVGRHHGHAQQLGVLHQQARRRLPAAVHRVWAC